MNLDQLPYQPGDIVRDRKTSVDYAVESVAGFTLAGGLTIVGVGLFNDKVNTWRANSANGMLDSHLVIRQGQGKVSGADMRALFRERIQDLLNRDRATFDALLDPENEALKDLLFYGVTSEIDDPSKALHKGYIQLAKTITSIGNNKAVTKESILKILSGPNRPPSITDEALETFAANMEKATFRAAGKNFQGFLTNEDVSKLFFNSKGQLGGDLLALQKGGNTLLNRQDLPELSKVLFEYIAGTNTGINGLLGIPEAELIPNTASADRIRLLAERMFMANSGDGQLSSLATDFLNRGQGGATSLLDVAAQIVSVNLPGGTKKSVRSTNPHKAGAELLLNAIANFLIDPKDANMRRQVLASAGSRMINFPGSRGSKLTRIAMQNHNSFARKAKENLNMFSFKDHYNRSSALRSGRQPLQAFRLMSVQEIDKAVKAVQVENFAVSKDAFYTSILGNSRVKIGRVEGTLRDKQVRDALSQIDNSADPYFVLSSQRYQQLTKQAAANAGQDNLFDLGMFINEQAGLKEQLVGPANLDISNAVISLGQASGDEAIIPLKKLETNNLVLKYNYSENGKPITGYTTNMDYAKEIISKVTDPDDVMLLGLANSNKGSTPHTIYNAIERAEEGGTFGAINTGPFAEIRNNLDKKGFTGESITKIDETIRRLVGVNAVSRVTGIETIERILSSKSNEDRLSLFTRYKHKGSTQEAFKASYAEGYEAGRLAIGKLKSKKGLSGISFLGSEVDQPIEVQLQRAREYFDGNGVLLDIEVKEDFQTGKLIVNEAAFGDSAGKIIHSFKDEKNFTAESQAARMIELAEQLKKQLTRTKNPVKVVGTAGATDFTRLIENTTNLIETVDTLEISDKEKDELRQKLQRTAQTFEDIQKNNLFDIQLLYPLAGENIVRQSYHTQRLLEGQTQKHTAVQDVKDAAEILKLMKEDILKGMEDIEIGGEEDILKKGLFIMENDTLSPNLPRSIKRILGTTEYYDQADKTHKTLLKYGLYDVKEENGVFKLVDTNRVGVDEYETAQQLALTLQKRHHIFTDANQINEPLEAIGGKQMTLAEKYIASNKEYATRALRSYNPLSITRYDPLGYFDDRMGSFGAFNLELDSQLLSLMPAIQKRHDDLIQDQLTANNIKELSSMHKLDVMSKLDEFIDDRVKAVYPMYDVEDEPLARDYLKLKINDALSGRGGLGTQVTDADSELSKLINSPAGQELLASAKVSLGAPGQEGSRLDRYSYQLKHIYYTAAAAEKLNERIKTATKYSDFLSESNARMSLKMGAEAVSFDVSNAAALETQELMSRMYDVSAEVMFASDKNKEKILPTLEKLGMGFEEFQNLSEQFKSGYQDQGLEGYKKAIRKLGYASNHEFRKLQEVQNALMQDNVKESFVNSLQEKIEKLQKFEADILVDAETKADFTKQRTLAEKILEDIKTIETERVSAVPSVAPAPLDPKGMIDDALPSTTAPTAPAPAAPPPIAPTPPTVPTDAPSNIPAPEPPTLPTTAPPKVPPTPRANMRTTEEVIGDISSTLTSYAEKNPETFNSLMRDKYLKPANLAELSEIDVKNINSTLFDEAGGIQETINGMLAADVDGMTMDHIVYDVAHHTSSIEGTIEKSVGARNRISEIITLHKQGNSLRSIVHPSAIKQQQELVNRGAAAARQGNTAAGRVIDSAANLANEAAQGTLSSASKMFSRVSVPLLALGGIVGLLAAKQPNLGDTFSQGNVSKSLGESFSGNENVIAKFSEIPGSPESQQIWYGGTMPFQIDMTFSGFVGNRMQHDKLQREVYNILNSNMEIRKTSGDVQDNRNKQHRMAAIEAMRGQM